MVEVSIEINQGVFSRLIIQSYPCGYPCKCCSPSDRSRHPGSGREPEGAMINRAEPSHTEENRTGLTAPYAIITTCSKRTVPGKCRVKIFILMPQHLLHP